MAAVDRAKRRWSVVGFGGPDRIGRRMIAVCLALAGGAGVTACTTTPTATPFKVGPERGYTGPKGLVAYVANTYDQSKGFIQPVCLADGVLGRRIGVGGQPFVIVVAPGGQTAYVADSGWDGPRSQTTVTPVNLDTDRAGPPIQAGLGPMGIGITPDGRRAYVADMGSLLENQTSTMVDADTVTPIDLQGDHPMKPIVVGPGVGAISITPDGKKALVGIDGTESHPQSHVEILNLSSGQLSAPISVGAAPMAIAITPDGREALVTDTGFNPIGHTVTPIDLSTGKAGRSITVGTAPIDIVLTPNGRTAFVANAESPGSEAFSSHGVVSVIDVSSNRVSRSIEVPGVPQSLAISPDGKTVYEVGLESFGHSALAPIDVATGKVGPAIQFRQNLGAVAIARPPRGFCG